MPTAQPLLLNQMPMLTTSGVQFILRPQATAKIQPQVQTAAPGLIIQPTTGQQLLQIQPQPARSQQPMVRVLTNGMQLQPSSTTYVTQVCVSRTSFFYFKIGIKNNISVIILVVKNSFCGMKYCSIIRHVNFYFFYFLYSNL